MRYFLLIFAVVAVVLRADEAKFVTSPKVARSNGKAIVSFSVNKPTDVEVSVLDAKGKIVRHLAAGVLGAKNPPPAPLEVGLSQEIVWDGNNDLGKAANGGPFVVRVRAGMSVLFGRMIGGQSLHRQCGCHAVSGAGQWLGCRCGWQSFRQDDVVGRQSWQLGHVAVASAEI